MFSIKVQFVQLVQYLYKTPKKKAKSLLVRPFIAFGPLFLDIYCKDCLKSNIFLTLKTVNINDKLLITYIFCVKSPVLLGFLLLITFIFV
jgi:hypothetical protein